MTERFLQQLRQDVELLEAFLTAEIGSSPETPPRLVEAMRLAVLGGGKRFRPFLLMESAQIFGIPRSVSVPVAAALECVHCYSLVHDDLPAMDNDKLRRGQPTVWHAFDEWTAILVGDALLTLAFEFVTRPKMNVKPTIRAELVHALARASGRSGMVGGQCLDLQSDKLDEPAQADLDYILRLQSMKTGALLRFACEAGAILGEADETDQAAMRRFGECLGLAFQISDDLLDVEGDECVVGKRTGKDAEAGKATLVGLLGIEPARKRLQDIQAEAETVVSVFGEKTKLLKEAALFVATRSN
jgi:farnesyl diphosphate synthase